MSKTLYLANTHTCRFILLALVIISTILLAAAYGKWFYPVQLLHTWERSIACCEVLFLIGLWQFKLNPLYWLFSTLVFASWGGYAYFWHSLQLPCHCMGEMLHIPTRLTLFLDGALFTCSALIAWQLNASKRQLFNTFVLAILFSATGFTLANAIYAHWIQPLYL